MFLTFFFGRIFSLKHDPPPTLIFKCFLGSETSVCIRSEGLLRSWSIYPSRLWCNSVRHHDKKSTVVPNYNRRGFTPRRAVPCAPAYSNTQVSSLLSERLEIFSISRQIIVADPTSHLSNPSRMKLLSTDHVHVHVFLNGMNRNRRPYGITGFSGHTSVIDV